MNSEDTPLSGGRDRFGLMSFDWYFIAYLVGTAIVSLFGGSRIPMPWTYGVWALIAVAGILGIHHWERRRSTPLSRFVRLWYGLLYLPLCFKSTMYIIPEVHPRDVDWWLMELDVILFGASPHAWIETWATPWLSDVLQLCYVSYYFLPIAMGIELVRRSDFQQVREFFSIIVLGLLVSYVGYYIVPGIGTFRFPHEWIGCSLPDVPSGSIRNAIHGPLIALEGVMRDAYPSGHTLVAVLCIYLGFRYRLKVRWVITPIALGLVLSTFYLRYHYVVDVIGGAVIAIALFVLGPWLAAKWEPAAPRDLPDRS